MKRIISLLAVIAMMATSFVFNASAVTYEGLTDSGLDYTESTEVFNNPMMGSPDCIAIAPRESGNTARNDSGFVHYFYDMKFFAAGYTIVKVNEDDEPIFDEYGNYVYDEYLSYTTTVNGQQVTVDNTKYKDYSAKKIPLPDEFAKLRKADSWNTFYPWACNSRNTGGNKDIPLSDNALNALRGTLENLRKNGGTCLIRPSYAINGDRYNECYDFEMMKTHARQLAEIFTEYSDVVGGVEFGTCGPFGEMWGSPYCGAEYVNPLLDLYLDNTPDTVKFMVRSPNYIMNYLCAEVREGTSGFVYLKDGSKVAVMFTGKKALSNLIPFDNLRDHDQEKLRRISMFNDGYMLTNGDTGTWGYCPRENGIDLLEWFSEFGYYGGEYGSGGYDPYNTRPADEIWLPENALPEMYRTHVSYIHGNVYATWRTELNGWYTVKDTRAQAEECMEEWIENSKLITTKDPKGNALDPKKIELIDQADGKTAVVFREIGYDNIPFTEELAKMSTKADVSAFYNYSCWTFINAHFGYRFVIRDSMLTDKVDNGGVMRFNLEIENTGFGNCVQDKIAQLVIVKDNKEIAAITLNKAADANAWLTQTTTDVDFEVRLPNTLDAGEYDAYLRVCNVTFEGEPNTKTCVRFANNDVYSAKLGANLIGSFTVTDKSSPYGTEQGAQVATKFADVEADYWGEEYIAKICTMGNMGGMSLTTFVPEGVATRAQLVTVLYNMEGKPAVDGVETPLVDINGWYNAAIKWAYSEGIVNGVTAFKFDPNGKLNRETFATMLYRYAKYKGIDVAAVKGDISAYSDAEKVSPWALEAMLWANAKGYIGGMTTTTLVPQGNATRAQMATILTRYIESNL
ncbi:MAG: DUF4832 domain-containing protein [Clostridia bacterium]|nr:DUF4832 domain-containing protein [Clostridia bacterium]